MRNASTFKLCCPATHLDRLQSWVSNPWNSWTAARSARDCFVSLDLDNFRGRTLWEQDVGEKMQVYSFGELFLLP